MTDKEKSDLQVLLAAVTRLLDRVPVDPPTADRMPRWHKGEKTTPPDSLY
jgi:hypothetical protein